MDCLSSIFLSSEQEYIDRFCEEYKDSIKTPDGFVISCRNPEQKAHHFCCGSINKFKILRAQRILWSKYILLHPNDRIVLENTKNKDSLVFFLTEKRKPYLVVCRIIKEKELDLISGFPVFGKKSEIYRKPQLPYKFYQN